MLGAAPGMDTIEEESSSAVQDSPLRQSPARPQQLVSNTQRHGSGRSSLQGLVQQQLHAEAPTSAQQQHSPMRSGASELHSGVGSLAQGLGGLVREALAAEGEGDEAASQVRVCWVVVAG